MSILGNESNKNIIDKSVEDGTLSHAFIIAGPAGSGKHTLTDYIAIKMAPEYKNKITQKICPDIIYINSGETRKSIGIESIRAIKSRVYLVPNELDFKMFIIENADTMTHVAQNALLKLLEEPPHDVYLMLLCQNTTGLLPTILSRAPILNMQIFNEEEMTGYLLANEKKAQILKEREREAFSQLIRSAEGNIGTAKKLLSQKNTNEINNSEKIYNFFNFLGKRNKAEFYLLINSLNAKRDEINSFYISLEKALRDLVLYNSSAKINFLFFKNENETENYISFFSNNDLCKINSIITEAHERLDLNVNIKITLIQFAKNIWESLY